MKFRALPHLQVISWYTVNMKSASPRKNIDAPKILRAALNAERKFKEEILLQATAIHFLAPKIKSQV